jgi:hypothetical protein
VCSCETRYSVTPRTSPISRSVSSSWACLVLGRVVERDRVAAAGGRPQPVERRNGGSRDLEQVLDELRFGEVPDRSRELFQLTLFRRDW